MVVALAMAVGTTLRADPPGAPDGEVQAHLRAARRLIDDDARERKVMTRLTRAQRHLEAARVRRPECPEVYQLMARICELRSDWASAIERMAHAARLQPALGVHVARLYRGWSQSVAEGNVVRSRELEAQGRASALASAQTLAVRLSRQPRSRSVRLGLARLKVFLEDFEGARDVLLEGCKIAHHRQFTDELAGVCVAWADHLADDRRSVATRVGLLVQGVSFATGYRPALQRLLGLTAPGAAQREAAHRALQDMLVEGKAPAYAHLLLGCHAWAAGQRTRAELHLEQSFKLGGRVFARVANSAATLLAARTPADLPRAQWIVERGLDLWPQHAELLDTRARIRGQLGR